MDYKSILEVVGTVLFLVLGFLVSYFKTHSSFLSKIVALMSDAESSYENNSDRKAFVVDTIYNVVPVWLKPILNKTVIGMINDSIYSQVKAFATKKLDEATNKATNVINTVINNEPKAMTGDANNIK